MVHGYLGEGFAGNVALTWCAELVRRSLGSWHCGVMGRQKHHVISAIPLLIQLPDNLPRKAEDGPSA